MDDLARVSIHLPASVAPLLDALAEGTSQAEVVRALAQADLRECATLGGIADPRVRHFHPRRVQRRGARDMRVALPPALLTLIGRRAQGLRMGKSSYVAALILQEWARRGYADVRDW